VHAGPVICRHSEIPGDANYSSAGAGCQATFGVPTRAVFSDLEAFRLQLFACYFRKFRFVTFD
jgi:hypothetical protein